MCEPVIDGRHTRTNDGAEYGRHIVLATNTFPLWWTKRTCGNVSAAITKLILKIGFILRRDRRWKLWFHGHSAWTKVFIDSFIVAAWETFPQRCARFGSLPVKIAQVKN